MNTIVSIIIFISIAYCAAMPTTNDSSDSNRKTDQSATDTGSQDVQPSEIEKAGANALKHYCDTFGTDWACQLAYGTG